uniref:DUF5672 domain-containing protein n=1 Tax=viral metagenome TaxID=1070528 RepID=A0A6C0H4P9_9ZZZZ
MDTSEWINYQSQFDLSPLYFQDIPEKTNKHCVIIEPRAHDKLIIVIKNFMYLLQKKGWGLIIFHSSENENMLKEGLKDWPNVIMINQFERNITIYDYNVLLCSSSFWKQLLSLGCHNCLIFQLDTVLLKDNIDDFIEYDYVGAPWDEKSQDNVFRAEIGNGGLSLRNVSKMLYITEIYPIRDVISEDLYFSFNLKLDKANLPSVEKAKNFSVETIYHPDTCGMHKPLSIFPSYEAFAELLSKRYDISRIAA